MMRSMIKTILKVNLVENNLQRILHVVIILESIKVRMPFIFQVMVIVLLLVIGFAISFGMQCFRLVRKNLNFHYIDVFWLINKF